MIFYRSFN